MNDSEKDLSAECERCGFNMPIETMTAYDRGAYIAYYCDKCLEDLDITSPVEEG